MIRGKYPGSYGSGNIFIGSRVSFAIAQDPGMTIFTQMAKVYLGIGSNIGDKEANCRRVIEQLSRAEDVEVIRASSFYLTEPIGGPPQNDYLNGILEIRTGLSPGNCLEVFKRIEGDMGRKPSGKDHPRAIDVDILLYDDKVQYTKDLEIPHPRMHEREFVLRGMMELAPDLIHPVFNRTIGELWKSLKK